MQTPHNTMHFNSFVILPILALCYAAAYSTATSALYTRDYFYVGGRYIQVPSGNTTSQYMVGQIYVEKLTPALVTKPYPIIFIAGAGQTGTNFLHTPDGREGWAHYFLSRGYVVYLTDQPERGRSPWLPGNGACQPTPTPGTLGVPAARWQTIGRPGSALDAAKRT